ncbi:MAG: hypothetical protein RL442_25 [Pseudomonadota bacterium]|jgi:hypothetical protein
MNDDLMFEYLLQMGAMRPDQEELKRKQAMVDALRQNAMTPAQGQMIGKHYVAPSITQTLAQVGQGYFAKKGQGDVDTGMRGMNSRQAEMLEELRKRRKQAVPGMNGQPTPVNVDPYSQFSYGNEA